MRDTSNIGSCPETALGSLTMAEKGAREGEDDDIELTVQERVKAR